MNAPLTQWIQFFNLSIQERYVCISSYIIALDSPHVIGFNSAYWKQTNRGKQFAILEWSIWEYIVYNCVIKRNVGF